MNFVTMKTNFILVLILFLIDYSVNQNISFDLNPSQQKVGYVKGDLLIGALFPIHEKSTRENSLICGSIREQYGIQRIEAALWTLKQINRSPDLRLKFTLGIEIRDSCWNPQLALRQSLQFVDSCHLFNKNNNETKRSPVIGVIGPASSEEAIQVQNLLQIFQIPEVGYSTTSSDLSDKNKYGYFTRVVPSDKYQALVIVRILQQFHWSYIFAISTEGNYAFNGMKEFKIEAEKNKICIARQESIREDIADEKLNEILRKFYDERKAKIIVCFCDGHFIRRLLIAAKTTNTSQYFVFIGTDGWAGRDDVVKGIEDSAQGNIMVRVYSPHISEFDQYYFDLYKRRNDMSNPWINEFWEYRFNCSHEKNGRTQECTGNENLNVNYTQDVKLSFIIKSIYTLAYGLKHYMNNFCSENIQSCFEIINGTLLMECVKNISFSYKNETVRFDEKGDSNARYDILNYQFVNGSYKYVTVGDWINKKFRIDQTKMQLPNNVESIESVCSKPCAPGEYKQFESQTCCWSCMKCKPGEIVQEQSSCVPCNKTWKPNKNYTKCVEMDVKYIDWTQTEAMICFLISLVGICLTLLSAIVFFKYRETPVVIYSSRELCFIMFFGMFLLHCCTFAILRKPSELTCTLRRIFPGVSLTVMYSALLLKTNRISRVFSMSKKRFPTLKPKYLSSGFQIFACCVIVTIEVLICSVHVIVEPTKTEKVSSPNQNDKVDLVCHKPSHDLAVPYSLNLILLIFCTLYAFKTRNLPDNFNESKFIGFSCYATGITWVAYLLLFMTSDSKLQIISLCLSLSTSALIILTCLFFPKLYVVLWRPKKNKRVHFVTTEGLRCHFGSTDSMHSKEFAVLNVVNKSQPNNPGNNRMNTRKNIKFHALPDDVKNKGLTFKHK